MTIQTEIDGFIDGVRNGIIENVLNADLPLVGDELQSAASTALAFLDELKSRIDDAFSSAPSGAQAITDALNAAGIPGVTASVDPGDSDKVLLSISQSASVDVPLVSAPLDFGTSDFGLDAQAAFDAIFKPALNASLSINTADGSVELVDSVEPELTVELGIGVDVSNGSGGPAEADLGPLQVKLTDNITGTTPEIDLTFELNLHSLDPTDITATASGGIDLNLGIETNLSTDVLPTIFTDLVVHYDFSDTGASDPVIQFENVSISLGSMLEKITDTIEPVLDIFSAFPFKQIISTVTDPLPIIGHIPELLPFLHLDPVPTPNGDGILNFLDLAAALDPDPARVASISKFATALAVIKQLTALNDAAAGDQKIDIGDLNLGSGGTLAFSAPSIDPLEQLNAFFADVPGIVTDVLEAIENVANELDPNPLKQDGAAAAGGLTFPLFDDPSKIINILVPALGNGEPVKFIEYTLPELSYSASIHEFFPVIGPIGLELDGQFSAGIQLSIGYDSFGLQTGVITDGFYLSTPLVDPTAPPLEGLPASPNGHMPVGFVLASIHAGAGIGFGLADISIEGGFTGGAEAFFPGGDLRFTEIAEGCFFDPFTGKLTADVGLRITVDLGLFSWTHRIVFAEATLADFSAECGGGVGVSDPGGALATPSPDILNGPDLLLNVGDRAGFRHIGGQAGTDVGEVYLIANATTSSDALSDPTPVPGVLAVNAFGITENYGSAANPIQTITAHLGLGQDSLSLAPDVTQKLIAFGDADVDRIDGGAGGDESHVGTGEE
jgi:hypothetical protein